MTALEMIIGMAPMAFGLGEGGEQNAPLGRAVIGGLLFATVATLIFVPVVFSIVHARYRPHSPSTAPAGVPDVAHRSEEHTSELQSLMRISYAVFCLKKKKHRRQNPTD